MLMADLSKGMKQSYWQVSFFFFLNFFLFLGRYETASGRSVINKSSLAVLILWIIVKRFEILYGVSISRRLHRNYLHFKQILVSLSRFNNYLNSCSRLRVLHKNMTDYSLEKLFEVLHFVLFSVIPRCGSAVVKTFAQQLSKENSGASSPDFGVLPAGPGAVGCWGGRLCFVPWSRTTVLSGCGEDQELLGWVKAISWDWVMHVMAPDRVKQKSSGEGLRNSWEGF